MIELKPDAIYRHTKQEGFGHTMVDDGDMLRYEGRKEARGFVFTVIEGKSKGRTVYMWYLSMLKLVGDGEA